MSQLTRAVDAGETGVDIVACAMDDDRIHGDEPITTGGRVGWASHCKECEVSL